MCLVLRHQTRLSKGKLAPCRTGTSRSLFDQITSFFYRRCFGWWGHDWEHGTSCHEQLLLLTIHCNLIPDTQVAALATVSATAAELIVIKWAATASTG